MIVHLRCDAGRPRAWIATAVAALAADHHDVRISWVQGDPSPPVGLEALFTLEHLLLHRARPCGALMLDDKQRDALATAVDRPDVIVDFTASSPASPHADTPRLRPLYNGAAGEDAALAAILAGDLPVIDIVDDTDRGVVDRGHPSSESASGLSGSLDVVMARTVTLIRANLAGNARPPSTIALPSHGREAAPPWRFVTAGLAEALAKRMYRLCCHAPQWHVGWRFTPAGVWQTLDLSGQPWRRLRERPSCFNADPFAVTWHGRTFVYFEELDHRTQKGVIAAIEFDDAGPTGEILPILEEPWHLSYPFLIEDGGQLWMVPESSLKGEVNLYRCVSFPGRWEHHATLLAGIEFADATITRHDGLYYMFGVIRDGGGGYSDTLAIYYARELTGPWMPHDENPIMIDRASARPAGNIVRTGGRLWRPVQDCSRGYGTALGLAEIIELSPHRFRQLTRQTIKPSAAWPGRKLHTLNRHGTLEVIDGSRIQPKIHLRF